MRRSSSGLSLIAVEAAFGVPYEMRARCLRINLAPVSDLEDQHDEIPIANLIDDTILPAGSGVPARAS